MSPVEEQMKAIKCLDLFCGIQLSPPLNRICLSALTLIHFQILLSLVLSPLLVTNAKGSSRDPKADSPFYRGGNRPPEGKGLP